MIHPNTILSTVRDVLVSNGVASDVALDRARHKFKDALDVTSAAYIRAAQACAAQPDGSPNAYQFAQLALDDLRAWAAIDA